MNTKILLLSLKIQSHHVQIFSTEIRILSPSLEFTQPVGTSNHIKASPAKALIAKILALLSKIMLTYTLILSTKSKPIRQGPVSS